MIRHKFRFLMGLTAALVFTVAPACATSILTYTDLASWTIATTGTQLIDFENGSLTGTGVQFLGINSTIGILDTSGISWMNYGTGKAAYVNLSNPTTLPHIQIILPTPVNAFSLNVFSANPNGLSFMISILSTPTTVATNALPNPAFFGITSDTTFTTIDLWLQGTASNSGAYELIDNVRFGTANQVQQTPEAATFLLIGSGLIALMVRRKRIMKNKPERRPVPTNPILSAC